MGRRVLVVVALLSPLALVLVSPFLSESARRPRPSGMATSGVQSRGSTTTAARTTGVGVDPNLPLVVGDSRRLVARAIDDTSLARHQEALVALGRRFLGTPSRSAPPGAQPSERLVLDLTSVDPLSFIEQLLALVNSREVRSRTEAVDRFSDHVRRLRYSGGRVDPCARLTDPMLWALEAERRGYLVDLTRFLPGAVQQRLSLQTSLQTSLRAASEGAAHAGAASCRPPGSAAVTRAVLPLEVVPAALPSLRSGDLFILVPRSSDRQRALIGLVDLEQERLGAVLVQPAQGVVRVPDLLAMARNRPGTLGLSFLRSVPNGDGRPDP